MSPIAREAGSDAEHQQDVWRALANPFRRHLLDLLSDGPRTTSQLVDAAPDLSRFAVMQHLGVLERSGVVTSHKTGRTRVYQLAPEALRSASTWLSTFRNHWERRLDQLDRLLAASTRPDEERP